MTGRRSKSLAAGALAILLVSVPCHPQAQPPPMFPLRAGAVEGVPAEAAPIPDGGTAPGADGRKSVGLAVIYSLLLPGMGELYAGDYGTGKYLTGVDGALWLSLYAVDRHANSIQDDARTFAALHAGFSPAGKDDDYYSDIGNFNDVYAYNEQVLRDRDAYKLYDPASADYWRWDAPGNREVYRARRVDADGMFNNTRFVVAGLLVNRVLSAINAARLVISGNRAAAGDGVDLGASVLGGPSHAHGIALSISRRF